MIDEKRLAELREDCYDIENHELLQLVEVYEAARVYAETYRQLRINPGPQILDNFKLLHDAREKLVLMFWKEPMNEVLPERYVAWTADDIARAQTYVPMGWSELRWRGICDLAQRGLLAEQDAAKARAWALERAALFAENAYHQECCGEPVPRCCGNGRGGECCGAPDAECCGQPTRQPYTPEEIAEGIRTLCPEPKADK